MKKTLWILTSASGLLAVTLGAFFAHALKDQISEHDLSLFNKASEYHFVHTLTALAALILFDLRQQKIFRTAAVLFLLGILCFSGSLYILAVKEVIHLDSWKFLIPITPLGGLLFNLRMVDAFNRSHKA